MRAACDATKVYEANLRELVLSMREPREAPSRAMRCSFGATRVGPFLSRLRMHLATERFLATRRGDLAWDAACDDSTMVLAHLETQLSPAGVAAPLPLRGPETPALLEKIVLQDAALRRGGLAVRKASRKRLRRGRGGRGAALRGGMGAGGRARAARAGGPGGRR